ncbi:MAG: SET domain-containing protein-lysine N-methyltransferase [Acidobacteria bacterium]|nr:SET domain-containing protein-lysine N-methyltransferase [Acidobacteriota bacterium]
MSNSTSPKPRSPQPGQAKPGIDARYCVFQLCLKQSRIHRWGLFAGEDIPANRKVIEYRGEKISRIETKRRSNSKLTYLFALNDYWCLDGSVGGSGAEYINHCCEPNIVTRIIKGHILYMTLRPIRKGEELTVDYRFAKNVERVPCKCGAKKCRGTINLLA